MKIFSLLKRVPKVKILIPLILIAGFSEAVGLAILIPIVSTLTNESQNNSLPGIFKYFEEILQIFPTDKQFIVLLGFALFFMILSYFLIYIQEKTVFKSRFRLLKDLRNNLTKSIVRSKWERISELSSGDISNSIIRESERGAEALLGLVMIMASIFQIIIYSFFNGFLNVLVAFNILLPLIKSTINCDSSLFFFALLSPNLRAIFISFLEVKYPTDIINIIVRKIFHERLIAKTL